MVPSDAKGFGGMQCNWRAEDTTVSPVEAERDPPARLNVVFQLLPCSCVALQ